MQSESLNKNKMKLSTAKQKLALLIIISLILPTLLLTAPIVLAAYSATISVVTNSSFTSTDMISLLVSTDIDYLKTNGYITSTGLDTRVKYNGSTIPFMLDEDLIAFANPISASQTTNLEFSTGNSLLSSFDIAVGEGGYITTSDIAGLEPGSDDWEIVLDGYFDTETVSTDTAIVNKDGAVGLFVDATDKQLDVKLNGSEQFTVPDIDSGAYELKLARGDATFEQDLTLGIIDNIAYGAGTYTDYMSFGGRGYYTTESDAISVTPESGTVRDLYIWVDTALGSGSVTTTLIKNGTPTSLTATITGTALTASDTSHDISVSNGDNLYWKIDKTDIIDAGSIYWWGACAFESSGSDDSIIVASTNTPLNATATRYVSPATGGYPRATEAEAAVPITAGGGALDRLYVELQTAPGVGNSFTFTVMVDGVASSLACTISGTDTTGSNLANLATYLTGDAISLRAVPSSNPDVGEVSWSVRNWVSGTEYTNFANMSSLDNTLTEYMYVSGYNSPSATYERRQYISTNCAYSDMYIELSAAPGVGTSYTFTLVKHGVDTDLTATVSNADTTASDTTHSVQINPGDLLTYKIVPSGTPTVVWGGIGVKVTDRQGDGVDLYIDDVAVGGIDFTSAITDNSNNWILSWDTIEYLDYYDYEIATADTIHYQPDSIIYSDTLPNEDDEGTFDGAITWGSMVGTITGLVSISIDPLDITEDPLPPDSGDGEGSSEANVGINSPSIDADDMAGETGQPGWSTQGTLTSNPFYPLISFASGQTNIAESVCWIMFAMLFVIMAMLGVAKVMPNHLAFVLIAGLIVIIIFTGMTVFPFWVPFVYVACGIALLLYERVPSV